MHLFSNRTSLFGGKTQEKHENMATSELATPGIKQEPAEEMDVERRLYCCIEKVSGTKLLPHFTSITVYFWVAHAVWKAMAISTLPQRHSS